MKGIYIHKSKKVIIKVLDKALASGLKSTFVKANGFYKVEVY